MREDIAGPQGTSSRPIWETLEGMVREKVQEFIQQIMEEEVTELLGREKHSLSRHRELGCAVAHCGATGVPSRHRYRRVRHPVLLRARPVASGASARRSD